MDHKRLRKRPLSIPEILTWARMHYEATGHWPTKDSGSIVQAPFETWSKADLALRNGLRGLPGGSSLAQLLEEHYGVRNIHQLPPLSVEQILRWADEYHEQTGAWPTMDSPSLPGSGAEKWNAIDQALRTGGRGLPGGSSLAKLLAEHRGVRNRKALPPYTIEQILAWADAHYKHHGVWPTAQSGPIIGAPGETWMAVQVALRQGRRGLPGGSSLARLLAENRNVRNCWSRPQLSEATILVWIDAFHARTGQWPTAESGPILEAEGETWLAVDLALRRGLRGLPGSSSLADLLARARGVRNVYSVPRLTHPKILRWADAHQRRTGKLPTKQSGPIPESPGDTWATIDAALLQGNRGLRPGSSLARLLAQYRGKRNVQGLPPLSKKKIIRWADEHHAHTGRWPNRNSGPVLGAPGERWDLIDNALRQGHRGLPGGSSLIQLLVQKRGVRHPYYLPPLTIDEILRWARAHRERTGHVPKYTSGAIVEAPGETWSGIDYALRYGKRGLEGGSSLAKLLASVVHEETPEAVANRAC